MAKVSQWCGNIWGLRNADPKSLSPGKDLRWDLVPESSVSWVGSERVRESYLETEAEICLLAPTSGHGKRGKATPMTLLRAGSTWWRPTEWRRSRWKGWFPGSSVRWRFRGPNEKSRRRWPPSAKLRQRVIFKLSRGDAAPRVRPEDQSWTAPCKLGVW